MPQTPSHILSTFGVPKLKIKVLVPQTLDIGHWTLDIGTETKIINVIEIIQFYKIPAYSSMPEFIFLNLIFW